MHGMGLLTGAELRRFRPETLQRIEGYQPIPEESLRPSSHSQRRRNPTVFLRTLVAFGFFAGCSFFVAFAEARGFRIALGLAPKKDRKSVV